MLDADTAEKLKKIRDQLNEILSAGAEPEICNMFGRKPGQQTDMFDALPPAEPEKPAKPELVETNDLSLIDADAKKSRDESDSVSDAILKQLDAFTPKDGALPEDVAKQLQVKEYRVVRAMRAMVKDGQLERVRLHPITYRRRIAS